MLDAAMFYRHYAEKPKLNIPEKFILATIHREENTNNFTRLKSIFQAFYKISQEIPIILPLHPRTKKLYKELNLNKNDSKVLLAEPVSYFNILYLLEKCDIVMTDSGGMQKEAYFFKKPCVTLRDGTEWVELVEQGVNILSGTNVQNIYSGYREMMKKNIDSQLSLYGRGNAGELIVSTIIDGKGQPLDCIKALISNSHLDGVEH
jgi:UDP-GlcNAc3NAcA epimerase